MEAEVLQKNYFFLQVFIAPNYEYVLTGTCFPLFLVYACRVRGVNCQ
jgi:hypothetical protein